MKESDTRKATTAAILQGGTWRDKRIHRPDDDTRDDEMALKKERLSKYRTPSFPSTAHSDRSPRRIESRELSVERCRDTLYDSIEWVYVQFDDVKPCAALRCPLYRTASSCFSQHGVSSIPEIAACSPQTPSISAIRQSIPCFDDVKMHVRARRAAALNRIREWYNKGSFFRTWLG